MKIANKIILILFIFIITLVATNPSLKYFSESYNYPINQCWKKENYFIFSHYTYAYDMRHGVYKCWRNYIGILGNFFEYESLCAKDYL